MVSPRETRNRVAALSSSGLHSTETADAAATVPDRVANPRGAAARGFAAARLRLAGRAVDFLRPFFVAICHPPLVFVAAARSAHNWEFPVRSAQPACSPTNG